jgi:N-acetylmuramoyl-L-alanine amidase
MSYTLHEEMDSPNYTPYHQVPQVFGGPRTLESITAHHWGAFGQFLMNVVNWLCRLAGNSSAHEVIKDGEVWTLIAHDNAAWAAGNPVGNRTSIHLELHPEATDGDYATAAERIRDIREMHGIDFPIRGHNSWIQTFCPGKWDLARLDQMSREIAVAPVAPVPAPEKPNQATPPGRFWIVDPGDTLWKIANYYGITIQSILDIPYNSEVAKRPDLLVVGEFIDIPEAENAPVPRGRGWIVDPGDTLGAIAQYYGVSVDYILQHNNIPDPNFIQVGDFIRVP